MKTPILFLAAFVAFLVLPVDFTVALSVVFAAGVATVFCADYGRCYVPPVPVLVTARPRQASLRLAA